MLIIAKQPSALHIYLVFTIAWSFQDASGRASAAMPWSRANDKQSESPPNIDRAMEADLESPSFGATGSNDYFEQARHRLSVMESSSTCKRAATIKLLDTCENLQTGTHDEDLESVQNLYAAHLAICELEGAARKLPQPCRLPLLSSSDGLALVLDGEGKARLRDCISALHSKSQSWTSYSNNRRDAYVWCKVMRPGFDQDEYAKSLKEVIAANGEVSKALNEFLSDNQQRMREQRTFMRDISVFKEQLARDLTTLAKETSETFKWLTREAGDATHGLLSMLLASINETRAEAGELNAIVHSGVQDAEGLRDVIAGTHRTLYDGISSVSTAQELQLTRTNEQIVQLQAYIETIIDTKINAAVTNATDLLETMTDRMRAVLGSIEQTKGRVEEIEAHMTGLAAIIPRLGTFAKILSDFRWPFVLVSAALVGWRCAVLLAAAFVLLGYLTPLIPEQLPSLPTFLIDVYDSVLSLRFLRPLIVVAIAVVALYAFTQKFKSVDPARILSHISYQPFLHNFTGRRTTSDPSSGNEEYLPRSIKQRSSQSPASCSNVCHQQTSQTSPRQKTLLHSSPERRLAGSPPRNLTNAPTQSSKTLSASPHRTGPVTPDNVLSPLSSSSWSLSSLPSERSSTP